MTHQDPDTTHEPPADSPSAGGVDDPHHGSPYASDDSGAETPWDAAEAPPSGVEEADGQTSGGQPPDSQPPDRQPPDDEATDDEAAAEDPLAAALRERDDYLEALQRKQADFENFRKRMMRDGATQRIVGHAEVAERMLDVLDDFDRTLANASDVGPGFLKGVELVHDKLVSVLTDFGLTRIDEQDVAFDPNRHEAVQQQDSADDLDEPRVVQVLRPGYELGGRVLRAAMVVVEQ